MLNKDYKGDVSAKDYRGRTALHIAAQKGNSNAIKELLSINSDLIHIVDNDNKNALHYAAETGQYSVVKSLVGRADNSAENNSKFLDINSVTNTGKTALMIAAERGNIDFVSYLLISKNLLLFSAELSALPTKDLTTEY
jgi:ankyrin repeat protein